MRGIVTIGLKSLLMLAVVIGLLTAAGCTTTKKTAEQNTIRDLEIALAQKNAELAEKARQIELLRGDMERLKSSLVTKQTEVDENKKLRDEAERMRKILSDKIDVVIRNGVVKLVLQNKILFDSGKAELKEEGKDALHEVSSLLNRSEYSEYAIRVEGHTDSDQIRSTLTHKYATNWELSTARATVVVRELVGKGKMTAERLYAAGYGEFHPVTSNATSAGKQMNRRVEIAILPKTWGFVPSGKGATEVAEGDSDGDEDVKPVKKSAPAKAKKDIVELEDENGDE